MNKSISMRKMVQQFISEAVERRKREDGSFDLGEVTNDLVAFAKEHPEVMDPHRWAKSKIEDHDRSRRPILDEPGFFDAEAYIPTGEGRRVMMKDANPNDYISWQSILIDQNEAHNSAHTVSMREINHTLRLFNKYPACRTRGQLEARLKKAAA